MCEHGTTVQLEVTVPASLSYSGLARRAVKDIDACLVPLVEALNTAGFVTVASCCGHGRRPGNVALADGRELIIARNWDEARSIDGLFPGINT